MERCNCWVVISNSDKAVCYGTKEREECSCNGDISKCNFYPEKRKEKKITTLEMMVEAKESGKTYTAKYRTTEVRYNAEVGFHYPGFWSVFISQFEYVNDIFTITGWEEVLDNEMTKSEAEAKFNIKIVGD